MQPLSSENPILKLARAAFFNNFLHYVSGPLPRGVQETIVPDVDHFTLHSEAPMPSLFDPISRPINKQENRNGPALLAGAAWTHHR